MLTLSKELAFIDMLLADDVRNNSAWNQRWFVVFHLSTSVDIGQEMEFCFHHIPRATLNEPPYNYLRYLFERGEKVDKDALQQWVQDMEHVYQDVVPFLSLLVDVQFETQQAKCHKVCLDLALVKDPIRANYWNYRAKDLVC